MLGLVWLQQGQRGCSCCLGRGCREKQGRGVGVQRGHGVCFQEGVVLGVWELRLTVAMMDSAYPLPPPDLLLLPCSSSGEVVQHLSCPGSQPHRGLTQTASPSPHTQIHRCLTADCASHWLEVTPCSLLQTLSHLSGRSYSTSLSAALQSHPHPVIPR